MLQRREPKRGRSDRRRAPPQALPALVLAVGVLASAAGAVEVDAIAQAKDQERFENAVDEAQGAIGSRLRAYVAVLRAAAGLFAAEDDQVTRREFRAFADRLDLDQLYPGIQGLGYSAVLPAPKGPATDRLLARLGAPEVEVSPGGARAETHAIVFLEPMDLRNRAAIGYDMYSQAARRAAMQRARDTGQSAMSAKVELVQEIDEDKQAGFLIYQPVYRGGRVPASLAERRAKLAGFAYSPFRADDLLNGIFGDQHHPRVEIAVYDGPVSPENLLHKSFAGSPAAMARQAAMTAPRSLQIAGRRWTVAYYSSPSFDRGSSRWTALVVLGGGLLATLLATAASWWQMRARIAAEEEIALRAAAESQRRLLMGELNHRVKNTLATVQSIAAQTLREGRSPGQAREAFEARLLALSHTHDLLTQESWRGAELRALVETEMSPYRTRQADRVSLSGEAVWLAPQTALALGMALHELATNAAKYGALSVPEGRVSVAWRRAEGPRLALVWRESGGPPVTPPTRRGFGARLIATGLQRQLDGRVELSFAPTGVVCEIDFPAPPDPSG